MISSEKIVITGGTFNSVTNAEKGEGIKLLLQNVACSALHDSAERFDPAKCHPGTRKAIIQEIMDWIETIDSERFFLWLYGPAGAGKSAIAQTIAELCCSKKLLAASFFFSRAASGRNDANLLIPTLTYQLTIAIPAICHHVYLAIEKDPLIFSRSLETQLEALIIRPLSTLPRGTECKRYPKLIIIDGLDECNHPHAQRYILLTLSASIRRLRHSVPLIFLVASRPEQQIRDAFNKVEMYSQTRRLILDDHYKPDADIRVFLNSKFDDLKTEHILASHLPSSWPSESHIEKLVQKSSGQFIYASTVMKFVQSPRHRPTERLDIIFDLRTPGNQMPFAELDALYMFIFTSVDDIDAVLDVFMFLLLFPDKPYSPSFEGKTTPPVVEAFWRYQPGHLHVLLADLHSVISVPSPKMNADKLRIFHASLGDFLMDRSRSARFFIDAPNAHSRMAEYCIKHSSRILSEPQTPENHTVRTLSQNWMEECVGAYPTKDLLLLLGSYTFDKHTSNDIIANHFSVFFEWLQQQCIPKDIQKSLCRRYAAQFDNYSLEKLSAYSSLDPIWIHLLTAFTLGSIIFNAEEFLTFIAKGTPHERASLKSLDRKLLGLINFTSVGAENDTHNYRSMLIGFLTDPGRSKGYHMDKSKYIALALKCLQYLCHSADFHPEEEDNTYADASAWDITSEILNRYPRDKQLVEFLRVNIIRENIVERHKISLAVEDYTKDAEAPPLRKKLLGAPLSQASKKGWASKLLKSARTIFKPNRNLSKNICPDRKTS